MHYEVSDVVLQQEAHVHSEKQITNWACSNMGQVKNNEAKNETSPLMPRLHLLVQFLE